MKNGKVFKDQEDLGKPFTAVTHMLLLSLSMSNKFTNFAEIELQNTAPNKLLRLSI
jgi:hypothetical protein